MQDNKLSGGVVRFSVLALLLVVLVGGASAFAGGSGTSSNPYEINSCSQLQDVGNDLTAHYELVSDVDCNGFGSFEPLGGAGDGDRFSGSFDGNGFQVQNLYISRSSTDLIGLFGSVDDGALVENLGVTSADVTGSRSVGIIAGEIRGEVRESYVTGSISGNDVGAGGITGYNYGTVSNTFSRANVDGNDYVGGLAGANYVTIEESYSTGSVSGSTSDVGGLVGLENAATSDSYWDTVTSGQSSSPAGTGLTTSQMTYPDAESNMAFDFSGIWFRDKKSSNGGYPFPQVFCGSSFSCNDEPQFNSSSVSPDPPLIGENVSYGAEVFDSDGSISYTNLSLSYEGSTVVSDEQRTGTVTPSWNDVFTPQTGDKWLNATLSVVDDAGAVTTKEINRYLSNDAPAVTINKPANSTFWSYENSYEIDVDSTGDSLPGENWSCDLYSGGDLVDTVSGTGQEIITGSFRQDLGQAVEFKASCSDTGGTTNKSEFFTVEDFEVQSGQIYSDAEVYETENVSYNTEVYQGSMIESVDYSLIWDGDEVDVDSQSVSGEGTMIQDLEHTIPLVSSNSTSKSWKVNFTVNRTEFDGSSSQVTYSTSDQSQDVWWSYWLKQADTNPDSGKYIETEDLKHEVEIGKESQKAEITGTTTYSRNGETEEMQVIDNSTGSVTLQGVIDTGIADTFNQSTFQTSSDIEIKFNGENREITTGQDTVDVYKIILTDGNSGLDTSKALEFDVNYEETETDAETRLTMDLSLWKNRDEKIRRYKFQEEPAKEHSYYIYPKWAEYNIRTLPYPEETKFDLIQYFNTDTGKVRRSYFFPTTQTISNQTTTVPLKTINMTEASRIDFEVTRSGGQPATNVYCRVDRKFGGGDFETVFMIKTGGEGNSQSFAEVNEIYYAFTCYKNGEVIETFPSQIMQSPMLLTIGEQDVETSLDYQNKFDASCTYNETSISCQYQSDTEKISQSVLTVERLEPVQDIQVCQKTSPTATGELSCNGLNTTENDYRYEVTGEYPGGNIFGAVGQTSEGSASYGAAGILLTLIIFLFPYAATSFNVPLGIAVGTLSLLFSSLAGFWVLTPTMRATLIAVAIIAGLVTRR